MFIFSLFFFDYFSEFGQIKYILEELHWGGGGRDKREGTEEGKELICFAQLSMKGLWFYEKFHFIKIWFSTFSSFQEKTVIYFDLSEIFHQRYYFNVYS